MNIHQKGAKDIVQLAGYTDITETTHTPVYKCSHIVNGDVTGDGKVDFADIIKINRFRLNKIKES